MIWVLKTILSSWQSVLTDGVAGLDVDIDFGELLDDRGHEDELVAIFGPLRWEPVGHHGRLVLVGPVSYRTK